MLGSASSSGLAHRRREARKAVAHRASAGSAAVPPPGETGAPVAGGARTPGLLEWVGVLAFFALCGLLLLRIREGLHLHPGPGGWAALAAVVGYLAADFFSGLVHWGFDTWGARSTPVLGPTFIVPFRVHHDDPKDITRHGFVATNGHNCLSTAPVLAAGLLLPRDWEGTAPALAFILALCFGVFLTNQFHKWAHEDAPGPVVAWLQRHHVVLEPAHHAVHHTAPFHAHYCITTGWMNGLLDGVRFFRGLEWLVIRVTGARPRRDDLTGKLL